MLGIYPLPFTQTPSSISTLKFPPSSSSSVISFFSNHQLKRSFSATPCSSSLSLYSIDNDTVSNPFISSKDLLFSLFNVGFFFIFLLIILIFEIAEFCLM